MQNEDATARRAALVTGASRGIGRAVALRLARDGFDVALGFSGNAALAGEVAEEARALGVRALPVRADVSREDEVRAMFAAVLEHFGGLHAVVHNAGIMALSPLAEGDVALFDKTIAVNLRGSFLVLGQAARHVARGGRIVALSSSVLGPAFPGYGPYAASKAGVEALVRVLANELRGREISVNAVAPGPVATELFLEGKPPEVVERLAKMPPLERLGSPQDVADVVSFLLGEGGWINAQVLRANGGFA